jgi:hypothetical protein
MKKFILCCILLGSSLSYAEDGGTASVVLPTGSVVVETAVVATGSADGGVASPGAPSLDAPLLSAKGFYTAVETGNGWLAAMFLLFFLVGLMRVVGKKVHAMIPDDTKHVVLKPIEAFLRFVFDTKIGGWIMNWLSAIGGCLSTAAMAGMPVDAAAWKVALMASTGGTVLIELKDDVMEWWEKRKADAEAKKAAKTSVVDPPTIVPDPPKA